MRDELRDGDDDSLAWSLLFGLPGSEPGAGEELGGAVGGPVGDRQRPSVRRRLERRTRPPRDPRQSVLEAAMTVTQPFFVSSIVQKNAPHHSCPAAK